MKRPHEILESRIFLSRTKSVFYGHPVFCGVRAHVHRGARPPCTWTNAHDAGASEPSIIVPCKKRRLGALTAVDHTSSNEWRHAGFAARKRRHGRMHPRRRILFENLNSRSAFFSLPITSCDVYYPLTVYCVTFLLHLFRYMNFMHFLETFL